LVTPTCLSLLHREHRGNAVVACKVPQGREGPITAYVTQYLEEVRRRTGRRYGKIKARAMESGTQQQRKARLEQDHSGAMRRNIVLGLGEHLAHRTQQGIVQPPA